MRLQNALFPRYVAHIRNIQLNGFETQRQIGLISSSIQLSGNRTEGSFNSILAKNMADSGARTLVAFY